MTPDGLSRAMTSIVAGLLALIIVGAAAAESLLMGTIEPALLVMATAVVATFFTGQAVRQVNGTKVDALTQAVLGMHTRLDAAGLPPSRDGTMSGGQG